MDKKTLVNAILMILAWVNTILASHHIHTIPVLDQAQVSMYIALVISFWNFVSHNWLGKKGKAQKQALVEKNLL